MPHSKQAKKRLRQADRRRIANRAARREIKTLTKTFLEHVEEKDAESAEVLLRTIVSKLDKATKTNVYHRNTAARRKARVASAFNALEG